MAIIRKFLSFSVLLMGMMFSVSCANSSAQSIATPADTFQTPGGKQLVINFIKHGSIEIVYDSLHIQVDPVATLPPATHYQKYGKADIILVTHEHYDHFSPATIDTLSAAHTIIVANARCRAQLRRGITLANGQTIDYLPDVKITAVPAYNTTAEHRHFHPIGRDNGYVLTLDGFRIYIAGDTEDILEMKELQKIDVAFLPCNQPYTMTPAQLRHAADMVAPRILYPYHYNDTPVNRILSALSGSSAEVRIRDLK